VGPLSGVRCELGSVDVVLAVLLVAVVVALVVHELGHFVAAHMLGARHVRVKWIRWGAAVEASFDDDGPRIGFLLAGPAASVLFGVVLVAIGVAGGGWWGLVGAVSILFGLLTLVGSDGRQAWALRGALARNGGKSNDPP
jgi:hypothetical protein